MVKKRIKEIVLVASKGRFSLFKKQEISKKKYDFSGIAALRQLLSNEKARILYTIKNQKPISIYDLAKKLNRSFKSVNDDTKSLQKFGLIKLVEEKTKNRKRYKPEIAVDVITIKLKI